MNVPTGKHMSREHYAAVQITRRSADLRYLARKAESFHRKSRAIPQADLDKMAELRADIARLKAGDFVTAGELEGEG